MVYHVPWHIALTRFIWRLCCGDSPEDMRGPTFPSSLPALRTRVKHKKGVRPALHRQGKFRQSFSNRSNVRYLPSPYRAVVVFEEAKPPLRAGRKTRTAE